MGKSLAFSVVRIILIFWLINMTFEAWAQPQQNRPNSVLQSPNPLGEVVSNIPNYNIGLKVNLVRTWDAKAAFQSSTDLQSSTYLSSAQSTEYLDGFGRQIQTVLKQVSPGSEPNDVVIPVVYDEFGRESLKYLPYVQSTGLKASGTFKINSFGDQDYFYKNVYRDVANNLMYPGEQVFYERTDFESSPLDRESKSFAAGNSWAGSYKGPNEKAMVRKYLLNNANDKIRIWNISNNPLTYINNDATTNIPWSSTQGIYEVGQLFKTVTIDENRNATVQYVDNAGKLILQKVQSGNVPTDFSGYDNFLCTYYVYDEIGRLRFIVPPKAVEKVKQDWILNGNIVSELCFRYEYDGLNRLIAKKVAGVDWNYMIYDTKDRMVFAQGPNTKSYNQWMTILFDRLNRPVVTGIITFSGTPAQLQSQVNTLTETGPEPIFSLPVDLYLYNSMTSGNKQALRSINMVEGFETNSNSEFMAEIVTGEGGDNLRTTIIQNREIDRCPLPQGSNFIALTSTNYDDYEGLNSEYNTTWNSNLDGGTNPNVEALPVKATHGTEGKVVSTKVRVIENPSDLSSGVWLTSVNYFDEKGRLIQTQTETLKGHDITIMRYNFEGRNVSTYLVRKSSTSLDLRVKTNFEFDHAGRLQEVWKTINDDPTDKVLISKNSYDKLGRLLTKEIGRKKDVNGAYSTNPLETLDYNYTVHGLLKGVNQYYVKKDLTLEKDRWFGMELSYDWGFEKAQLSGNISGIKWRAKGDAEQRAFGFTYDGANRILGADFSQSNGTSYVDNLIVNFDMQVGDGITSESAYDENGNIKLLKQWGLKTTSSDLIDHLKYTYEENSNKLKSVTDFKNSLQTNLRDFRSSNSHPQYATKSSLQENSTQLQFDQIIDFEYDNNGNLKYDNNKGISTIKYNHLNLPIEITVPGKGKINYVYDANGRKLRKTTIQSSVSLQYLGSTFITDITTETN